MVNTASSAMMKKHEVDVELLLQPQCGDEDAQEAIAWVLSSLAAEDDWYWRKMPSNQPLLSVPPTMQHIIHSVTRCDMQDNLCGVLACQVSPKLHTIRLHDEDDYDDVEVSESDICCREWLLPNVAFAGIWSSLILPDAIKKRIFAYANSALAFANANVSRNLCSSNNCVLLHGPPGTGKTSLAYALANKLAVRNRAVFPQSTLVEVHAHSLFSKYFSESGKLVAKLFANIHELLDNPQCLVFVLVDEVESLTAARKAGGNEPTDALRAVNALLTQLDSLKRFPNAMVLATTNLSHALDVAFLDRADIKCYIGPPCTTARYEILRSSVAELLRTGILRGGVLPLPWDAALAMQSCGDNQHTSTRLLLDVAAACDGGSGRLLRKLPLLAHAALRVASDVDAFLVAMKAVAAQEADDRTMLQANHLAAA